MSLQIQLIDVRISCHNHPGRWYIMLLHTRVVLHKRNCVSLAYVSIMSMYYNKKLINVFLKELTRKFKSVYICIRYQALGNIHHKCLIL